MRLLMISALNEMGAELAEEMCRDADVTVWHPGVWPLESRFQEVSMTPQDLGDLSGFDAAVYLASGTLDIAYLESLLERLRAFALPCICLEPRAIAPRQGTPLSAEQSLCRLYQLEHNLPVSWVSMPALYGDDFLPDEWMHRLLKRSRSNAIELCGDMSDACDLLHVSDAATLIQRLLQDDARPGTFTLGSGYVTDLHSVAEVFRSHFRLSDVRIVAPAAPVLPIQVEAYPAWSPRHAFLQELPCVLREVEELGVLERRQHHSLLTRTVRRVGVFALLFACVCLYTGFIQVSSELQFVDVRLLFVIGISLYMGRGYGIAASLCSSVVSVFEALSSGTHWHTIFFHIDNWIPIAVYLAAAVLFGMYSENHHPQGNGENEP